MKNKSQRHSDTNLCEVSFDEEDGSVGDVIKSSNEETKQMSEQMMKEQISKKKSSINPRNEKNLIEKKTTPYEYEKDDLDLIRFSYKPKESSDPVYFKGIENEADGNCFFEALVDTGMFDGKNTIYAVHYRRKWKKMSANALMRNDFIIRFRLKYYGDKSARYPSNPGIERKKNIDDSFVAIVDVMWRYLMLDTSKEFEEPKKFIDYHATDRAWVDGHATIFCTLIFRVNIILFTGHRERLGFHIKNAVDEIKAALSDQTANRHKIQHNLTDITKTVYIYQHSYGLPLDNYCSVQTNIDHYIGLKVTNSIGKNAYGSDRMVFSFPWTYDHQKDVVEKGHSSYTAAIMSKLKPMQKKVKTVDQISSKLPQRGDCSSKQYDELTEYKEVEVPNKCHVEVSQREVSLRKLRVELTTGQEIRVPERSLISASQRVVCSNKESKELCTGQDIGVMSRNYVKASQREVCVNGKRKEVSVGSIKLLENIMSRHYPCYDNERNETSQYGDNSCSLDISINSRLHSDLVTNVSLPSSIRRNPSVVDGNKLVDNVFNQSGVMSICSISSNSENSKIENDNVCVQNENDGGKWAERRQEVVSIDIKPKKRRKRKGTSCVGFEVIVNPNEQDNVSDFDDLMKGVQYGDGCIDSNSKKGSSHQCPIELSSDSSNETGNKIPSSYSIARISDIPTDDKYKEDIDKYCFQLNIGFDEGNGNNLIKLDTDLAPTKEPTIFFEMSYESNIRRVGNIKLQYRTNEKKTEEGDKRKRNNTKRARNRMLKTKSERLCREIFGENGIYKKLQSLDFKVKFIDTGRNYKIWEGNVFCNGEDEWRIAASGTQVDLHVNTAIITDMIESTLGNRDHLVMIEVGKALFKERERKKKNQRDTINHNM